MKELFIRRYDTFNDFVYMRFQVFYVCCSLKYCVVGLFRLRLLYVLGIFVFYVFVTKTRGVINTFKNIFYFKLWFRFRFFFLPIRPIPNKRGGKSN